MPVYCGQPKEAVPMPFRSNNGVLLGADSRDAGVRTKQWIDLAKEANLWASLRPSSGWRLEYIAERLIGRIAETD